MEEASLTDRAVRRPEPSLGHQALPDQGLPAATQLQGGPDYLRRTYDEFLRSVGDEAPEHERFAAWRAEVEADDRYAFECLREGAQRPVVQTRRTNGRRLEMISLSSYNYLGLGYHPDVLQAAKDALDRFGLGAASSPINGGTLGIHEQLELRLLDFLGLPERGVSLFSSGYGVNTGVLSAVLKRRQHAVLDELSHASIVEGAQLSGAKLSFFRHNDMDSLREVLAGIEPGTRTLICTEGIFSGDGDYADLRGIVAAAKATGAMVMVDEAHSIGLAGPNGRGVAEAQDVLGEIDFFVVTFSKALGGVGGAVVTSREWATYINWYARCRMFSCALDPAVAGGIAKGFELLGAPEGAERRERLHRNARLLRERLAPHIDLGVSQGWIVTVWYGDETMTLPLIDYIQRRGLDTSLMQFPAVPSGESRLRLFVTSEHSEAQLERASDVVLEAAREFGFVRPRGER